MESTLSKTDIETFWLRLYFDLTEGFELAAIKRAYLDFSRTLENLPKDEDRKKILKENWLKVIQSELKVLLSSQFSDYNKFTAWHSTFCYKLRTANSEYNLTQGQAQKWINMTLKYLYAFGEKRITGITYNYPYFHVPIDNIVLKQLALEGIENPFDSPWSKIKNYADYQLYQQSIRDYFIKEIPMDVEFRLFNKA